MNDYRYNFRELVTDIRDVYRSYNKGELSPAELRVELENIWETWEVCGTGKEIVSMTALEEVCKIFAAE